MALLTATSFLSLDGVFQGPGAPDEDTRDGFIHGGWLVPFADDDVGAFVVATYARASAFVFGRITYDLFAAQWQNVVISSDPVAHRLHTRPKYVASRSQTAFSWSRTNHLADVVADVQWLKASLDGEIQVHGSGNLLQTLIAHDLVDEFRLLIVPVVLGTGRHLFQSDLPPRTLSLIETTTTSGGAVILRYRKAGPLSTGSFATNNHSL